MGIPKIPNILVKQIQAENCVVFVGAGLSQNAGLPNWQNLLLRLIDYGQENGRTFPKLDSLNTLISERKYLEAADVIERRLGQRLLRRSLEEIIRDKKIFPTEAHALLTKISFKAVLTTNYDKLLEKAWTEKHGQGPIVIDNANRSKLASLLASSDFYILKAHGDIDDPSTIVLGSKSFKALVKNGAYVEHVKTVFRTRTIFFVGFSLSDPDFLQIMKEDHFFTKDSNLIHYALLEDQKINSERKKFFNQYGIEVLFYQPSTETHPEVKEFLENLFLRVSKSINSLDAHTVPHPNIQTDPPSSETDSVEINPKTQAQTRGQKQIQKAAESFRKYITKGDDQTEGLEIIHALRLQLLLSASIGIDFPDNEVGIHEINRLYLSRTEVDLVAEELNEILRQLVRDDTDYRPGWYWFKDYPNDFVESVILMLAHSDRSSVIRSRAFNLITQSRIGIDDDSEREYIEFSIKTDASPNVRRAALAYVGQIGGSEFLPTVGAALIDEESKVVDEAKISKYRLLARSNPSRALSELLNELSLDVDSIITDLADHKNEIRTDILEKALEYPKDDIRLLAFQELRRRGGLSEELAEKLKEDSNDYIKAHAYEALLEVGKIEPDYVSVIPDNTFYRHISRNSIFPRPKYIDRTRIILSYYQKFTFDQLEGMIDWKEYQSLDIYRALALVHFDKFGERLRKDLIDSFKIEEDKFYLYKLEQEKEWESTRPDFTRSISFFGSTAPKKTIEEKARADAERIKYGYIKVALNGLAKNGNVADLEFGRRFISHEDEDIRIEAVKILRQWGDDSDLPSLVKIAKSNTNLLQELAAQVALQISKHDQEVVREFLISGDEILVSIAISDVIANGARESFDNLMQEYLDDKNDEIRNRAMVYFFSRFNREELEKLLIQYLSKETYYYSVVCGLDRILYAPLHLQKYYLKNYEDKFFGFLQNESRNQTSLRDSG